MPESVHEYATKAALASFDAARLKHLANYGPDEEVAAMVRNLAESCAALWREVHVHRDVDGCPDRSHLALLEWLEQAEIALHRFAHLTATRTEG